MILIDPDSGAIVDANPAASTYYGWNHEELLKMKIEEINTFNSQRFKRNCSWRETKNVTIFSFNIAGLMARSATWKSTAAPWR